jgi:AraC-like DNA-binding protein
MSKLPILQKLPLAKGTSFIYENYVSPYFETPWHYHEEIEIVLCHGGIGKKIVGNHVSTYAEGDLMLLGSNLPHWFKADEMYYVDNQFIKPASIVIQFNKNSFGHGFFEKEEMAQINALLYLARFGLSFYGATKAKVASIIIENLKADPLTKFINLVVILKILAESKEQSLLSEIGMIGISERMNLILDYILANFKQDISLEKIAEITNLAVPSLCRYFKMRTQKTIVEYINEIRLNHACRLLQESEMNVAEICFECGFNNLSNFNRLFRNSLNTNPKSFRKEVLGLK